MWRLDVSPCLFALIVHISGQTLVAPPGANELEICIQARMYISQYSERYKSLVEFPTSIANVDFGSNSRKMSNRLSVALQQFITDVDTTLSPSYVFQVSRTFEPLTQWPSHPAGAQDLFYEGRAIDLRFGTRSSSGSITYGPAPASTWQDIVDIAGGVADYATFTDGSLLHMSVAPDGCEGALDLAFLVDGSGSISEENWPTATDFLERIANFTTIAPDKTRVAVTTFSSQSWLNLDPVTYPDSLICRPGELWSLALLGGPATIRPFCRCCLGASCTGNAAQQIFCARTSDQYNLSYGDGNGCGPCENPIGLVNGTRADLFFSAGVSRSAVLDAIAGMTLPDGGTWTSRGLDFVQEHVFTTAAGMRPLSDGVPRVLVVMTDGESNVGYNPADAARRVRNAGVTVVALRIGVTSSSISAHALAELRSIASSDALAIVVPTFSALASFTTQIDTQTCFACTNGPANTLVNVELQNEQFQCFSPCGAAAKNITEVVVTALDGSATVYLAETRYGGSRNNTASVNVLPQTTRTLTWPGSGFVIFYGTASNTNMQITMQSTGFAVETVPTSVLVNASVAVDTPLIDLSTFVAPSERSDVEYQFLARSGSNSNFTVRTSGEVRVANALAQSVEGNTTELVSVRATPVAHAACASESVSSLGTVYDFEINVTVIQMQAVLSLSDDKESGANIGAIFGILIFLCLLLLLALFVLKKRKEAREKKLDGAGTVNPLYRNVQDKPLRPISPNVGAVVNTSYQQAASPTPPGAEHEYGTVPEMEAGGVCLAGASLGESSADDSHYGIALNLESSSLNAVSNNSATGDHGYTDIAIAPPAPGTANEYADVGDPASKCADSVGPATYEVPVPGSPLGYKKFRNPGANDYADAKHVGGAADGAVSPYADAHQVPPQPRPDGTIANESYVPVRAGAPPQRPDAPPVPRARENGLALNACYTTVTVNANNDAPQPAPPTRPSAPPTKAPPPKPPRPSTDAPTRAAPPKPSRPPRPGASASTN
eukprot:m.749896 g.749896  ORF g.749896 m.749896 type:complete len:1005 (-) comp23155_c0_seq1:156-3170(-)